MRAGRKIPKAPSLNAEDDNNGESVKVNGFVAGVLGQAINTAAEQMNQATSASNCSVKKASLLEQAQQVAYQDAAVP